ncbi:Cell division cycle protein cdt2 [Ceratocystis lukuohia]|uniref:Cell division cycle protein cdt2 n=1 Tax=Ceratocystis lukuohia TaxID=2019550 RepID=A0ABR4MK94_9PEZI
MPQTNTNFSSSARSPSAEAEKSAAAATSPNQSSARPKKVASVTPKRFARFFTPRTTTRSSRKRNAAEVDEEEPIGSRSTKRQLFPAAVQQQRSDRSAAVSARDVEWELPCHSRPSTENHAGATIDADPSFGEDWMPYMSSPYLRHSRPQPSPGRSEGDDAEEHSLGSDQTPTKARPMAARRTMPAVPIKRAENISFRSRLLYKEFGDSRRFGRASMVARTLPYHSPFVTSLYSKPTHVWFLNDLTPRQETTIPFSMTTATCNGSKHMAFVGDSNGTVHGLEMHEDGFPQIARFWRAHENAITAIDTKGPYLATASGDRTARVVDFETGKTLVNLDPSNEALRDIRFRPSDPHVLMTSSRGGVISIFDIRHRQPTHALDCAEMTFVQWMPPRPIFPSVQVRHSKPIHTISRAYAFKDHQSNSPQSSITAVQWLPTRDHLIVSAGGSDASLTLWDSRYISRNNVAPLAHTDLPANDPYYTRNFGVTSLSLSSDGSRIYSTCRNSSIYAYSVPHLILGQAPELEPLDNSRLPHKGLNHRGLGPLFSLRHDDLGIDSFWIKSSIQPSAVTGSGDILAVGNSKLCPVVFNVDEKTIRAQRQCDDTRPRLFASSSYSNTDSPDTPSLPCIMNGVTLYIENQDGQTGNSETTSVAWQANGSLVATNDRGEVRFWHHDTEHPASLRAHDASSPVASNSWANVPQNLCALDSQEYGEMTSPIQLRRVKH